MVKFDTLITVAVIGAVGVGAFLFLKGIKGTGISLNPVDWGKSLGQGLQDVFKTSSTPQTYYNSDGSPIPIPDANTGRVVSTGTFPNGDTYTIDIYGIQHPSDAEYFAAHPESRIYRDSTGRQIGPPTTLTNLTAVSRPTSGGGPTVAGSSTGLGAGVPLATLTPSSSKTVLDLTSKAPQGAVSYNSNLKVFTDSTGRIVGKKAVGVWK
jgi:hypothetical protein